MREKREEEDKNEEEEDKDEGYSKVKSQCHQVNIEGLSITRGCGVEGVMHAFSSISM